jgi:hypothetical protein
MTLEAWFETLAKRRPGKPHYTLDELMAQCDLAAPVSDESRDWLDSAPIGREEL